MIVLFSEHDKNPDGKYPFELIMLSHVAIAQQEDGTFEVLKDRYNGAVGSKASLYHLEDWAMKEKAFNDE